MGGGGVGLVKSTQIAINSQTHTQKKFKHHSIENKSSVFLSFQKIANDHMNDIELKEKKRKNNKKFRIIFRF